jgi:hypothetical protein
MCTWNTLMVIIETLEIGLAYGLLSGTQTEK